MVEITYTSAIGCQDMKQKGKSSAPPRFVSYFRESDGQLELSSDIKVRTCGVSNFLMVLAIHRADRVGDTFQAQERIKVFAVASSHRQLAGARRC